MNTQPRALPLAAAVLPDERTFRIAGQIGLVIVGSLLIALSSKVKVPMWPVEMSLQTLAIFTIAAAFGRRLGLATILLYMAEGVAGLPVFQGTPEKGIGLLYMAGPTGGYLLGFVVMTVVAGWAADRGYGRQPLKLFAAMLAGEIIMLALGALWLGYLFGIDKAFAYGIGPFIVPDLVKVALAASVVSALTGLIGRFRRDPA